MSNDINLTIQGFGNGKVSEITKPLIIPDIILIQEWQEDDSSKIGWSSFGWEYENRTSFEGIDYEFIEALETDKHGHLTKARFRFDIESKKLEDIYSFIDNNEDIYQELIVKPHHNINFETILGFAVNWELEYCPTKIEEKNFKATDLTKELEINDAEMVHPKLKPIIEKKIIEPTNHKAYLFENNGLVTHKLREWVLSIAPHYKEINTEVRNYMRDTDLWIFALLIDPKLTTIVTSSCFITKMPFEACVFHNKETRAGIREEFTQLDYYSWLIYQAAAYRKINNLLPLVIYLNYECGDSFLKDLKDGDFGQDTIMYLKLMLRQSEGFVSIKLYQKFKFVKDLIKEEDLMLEVHN